MQLSEFLRMLHGVRGPNASGEYSAKCPAHDDGTASLTVTAKRSSKDGKERIYFYCQTKVCTTADILRELGLTTKDLIIDPDEPGQPRKPRPMPPKVDKELVPGLEIKQAKPGADKPAAKGNNDLGKLVQTYAYKDAAGKVLFEVCRFERADADGNKKKTFRQRVKDPSNPKAVRGYVWSVPDGIRENTIYHLPEVLAAIKAGRTVYVAEGEKDADTMARLGYAATCNAMGTGKWTEQHSALLTGADVIILGDCDVEENHFAGQKHAWDVAEKLTKTAKRVRMPDLKAACPNLPPKGDITDMVELMGDRAAMEALARQITMTRDFDPAGVPTWLTPAEQAAVLYGRVPGYCAEGGRICANTTDGAKPLANFVAIPRAVITRDDGVNVTTDMAIDGWSSTGRPLPRTIIKAAQFNGMGWITEKWAFEASLMPGNTAKEKVRYAISEVGRMAATSIAEYNHTGWRKIGGKWCYLYQGGAIGAKGVTVDLGNSLNVYRLDGSGVPDWDEITPQEAAAASMNIMGVIAPHVAIPLLGTIYLAPLREFLAETGVAPAYALFLLGHTGCRKSTAAALGLSHFGNFTSKNLPASFNDTSNFIRKKAFLLKDAPIVVDDYHPVNSIQERRQMEATAQSLARAFGDGAERGRMKADTSLQSAMPPRGVAIISGEDTPGLGESGLARFHIVNVGAEDVPANDALTAMQEQARRGYLQKAMAHYIRWLLQQVNELPTMLHDIFLKRRELAQKATNGQHGRAAESIAHIMIGYESMLRFFRDCGIITTDDCIARAAEALKVLTDNSSKQAADTASNKPTQIFLTSLAELLASKAATVKDIGGVSDPEKITGSPKDMVGYMDDDYYYLLPQMAFSAVSKLCKEQDQTFPVSLKALYKNLRTDGVLKQFAGDDTPTRGKWIDGRTVRLLWIPRASIDGAKATSEQIKMGFQQVDGSDMPDEWQK